MSDELKRSTQELWKDYEFLTKEIGKFIVKGDDDLVNDLINQRERLQAILEEKNDREYAASPEGKALIAKILAESKNAASLLQQRYNQLKQQHKLSQTYDGNSIPISTEHFLDKQM